jgi:hypothetical protein
MGEVVGPNRAQPQTGQANSGLSCFNGAPGVSC